MDELADMDREVEDILQDTDGGESDEEEEEPADYPGMQNEEENGGNKRGNYSKFKSIFRLIMHLLNKNSLRTR